MKLLEPISNRKETMNLKKIRSEKGITQKELATTLGINQNNISRYEAGDREPNLDTLKKLATVLEVTVDELIGDDDDEGRV